MFFEFLKYKHRQTFIIIYKKNNKGFYLMIYLNGEFKQLENAYIHVLDRGFIFGDGVYEVIPVYNYRPFELQLHLDRLNNSLNSIGLKNPHTNAEWTKLIEELIRHSLQFKNQAIYLHITRGVAKRDHAFPDAETVKPTVFMMTNEFNLPPAEKIEHGISTISVVDNRWLRCNIKMISLLPNVLLRQQAVEAGTVEAILFRDGFLTEGSASNIFVVKDNIILIPPRDNLILPGVTYDVVVKIIQDNNLPHEIRQISEAETKSADELWLTSSTKEILPITQLDEKPVGNGHQGTIFRQVFDLFQAFKAESL